MAMLHEIGLFLLCTVWMIPGRRLHVAFAGFRGAAVRRSYVHSQYETFERPSHFRHQAPLMKVRLDKVLVDRGLCVSRAAAKNAIDAGFVKVDGEIMRKSSAQIFGDATVTLSADNEKRKRSSSDRGYSAEGSKGKGKSSDRKGGKGKAGGGGDKPTDSQDFVVWSEGMRFEGSRLGVSYVADAYVASGTFSRVFRVRKVSSKEGDRDNVGQKRRWCKAGQQEHSESESALPDGTVLAAKVMRRKDAYIQYTSDAEKEGAMLQKLEQVQLDAGKDVLTMRCLDSFATSDDAGNEYWCLILEWLDASIFDIVKANGNRGLHLSMVRIMLQQLLEQLHVLQDAQITHTDIKHKNCCLLNGEHFLAPVGVDGKPSIILTRPMAKFIDYGNAVFEGDKKIHPIHTKQFRAPEVLLNIVDGWGPPSDTWTVGVTAVFMVSGQLIFNSHDPNELLQRQVEALGPFPDTLLASARDGRTRRAAELASSKAGTPQLARWLGFENAHPDSAEARCVDLLSRMLDLDPAQRILAREALKHPFLTAGEPQVPDMPENAPLRNLR